MTWLLKDEATKRGIMNFFDKDSRVAIYYGKLPHWRQNSVCYFVTFRTADSIPQVKLNQWLRERKEWLEEHPEPRSEEIAEQYHKLFTNKLEGWLDSSYGECLLSQEAYHDLVKKSLLYFDDQRYKLLEYTIAANHVHLLLEPLGGNQLSDIMRSIKSYTANEINKATGIKGHFWQKEYFDHIVRSVEQFQNFALYIRNHAVGATSCRSDDGSCQRQDDVAT